MSLSIKAVDRIFVRMMNTYGVAWDRGFAGVPDAARKSVWQHELAGFANERGLMAIAWALENLPEDPPNAIEFRNLARRAVLPEAPALAPPETKADPARVKAEFAKLADLRADIRKQPKAANLDWARRILARRDCGDRVSPTVLGMAQSALGMPVGARRAGV